MYPFSEDSAKRVTALGERALISAIREWLAGACPPHPHGIGDDCAVVPWPKQGCDLLITTDPVVYGRHFDASVPASAAGAKLLKRNLSDIAAMGGEPVAAVVSCSLPASTSIAWLRSFYKGLARTSLEFGVPVVGGDISSSETELAAHLTLTGRVSRRTALTRSGGSAGDVLYVTGSLGGSILGKHHRFTPRLQEAVWLRESGVVSACMDISDGLAKDLTSMVPQGLVAVIDSQAIPIARAARDVARKSGRSALEHALCDGEDYELLLCLRNSRAAARVIEHFSKKFSCGLTRIGTLEPEAKPNSGSRKVRSLDGKLNWMDLAGYEHLRTAK